MTNTARRLQRSLGEYNRSYGDMERAENLLRESLRTAEKILREARAVTDEAAADDGRRGVAVTQSSLADLLRNRGQYDEAERLYRESLAVKEEIGDRRSVAVTQANLAIMLRQLGRIDETQELLRSGLTKAQAVGDQQSVAVYMMRLGELALDQGQQEEAIPLLADARQRFLDIGLANWAAEAERLLAQAQAESRSLTLHDVLSLIRAALAGDETAIESARALAGSLAQTDDAEMQTLGQALGRLLVGADSVTATADLPDELAQQIQAFDW